MESKPQLPEELAESIEAATREAYDLQDSGDAAASLATLEHAWSLLPDPKDKWDYYDQGLSTQAVECALAARDLEAAELWLRRMDRAYSPHDDTSHFYVNGYLARWLYYDGKLAEGYALLHQQYEVLGNRAFGGDKELQRFHADFVATGATQALAPDAAGWDLEIPAPGQADGEPHALSPEHAAAVEKALTAGGNYCDLGAPQAAAEEYVSALSRLPEPIAQWASASSLYVRLGSALMELTQWHEAKIAYGFAIASAGGDRSADAWLGLGDAERKLGGSPVDAYARAMEVGGPAALASHRTARKALRTAGISTG